MDMQNAMSRIKKDYVLNTVLLQDVCEMIW